MARMGEWDTNLTSWECCDDRHSECKFRECVCGCHAKPAEPPRTPEPILLPSEVHAIAREIVADADAERDAIAEAEARPDLWLAELEAENASLRLAALPTRKHSDAAWERKVTELGADAMIAHRWFEKRFGEVMNGRDFAVKCEMADRDLASLTQRAKFGDQCWQDQCEGALVEATALKRHQERLAELLAAALEGANWVEIATDSEEWPSATLADMNACIVRLRAAVADFGEGK